jgi:hypothetical protein
MMAISLYQGYRFTTHVIGIRPDPSKGGWFSISPSYERTVGAGQKHDSYQAEPPVPRSPVPCEFITFAAGNLITAHHHVVHMKNSCPDS